LKIVCISTVRVARRHARPTVVVPPGQVSDPPLLFGRDARALRRALAAPPLVERDVRQSTKQSRPHRVAEGLATRVADRQPDRRELLAEVQHRPELVDLVVLEREVDLLVAEEEHDHGPAVRVPVLQRPAELVDGAARSVVGRCAGALPHDAEVEVVLDRDLVVDHGLRRTDVGERVRLVLHELESHVLRRREELHGLVDVAQHLGDDAPFEVDVRRRRQEDPDDLHGDPRVRPVREPEIPRGLELAYPTSGRRPAVS
jgi:hypothetical protein